MIIYLYSFIYNVKSEYAHEAKHMLISKSFKIQFTAHVPVELVIVVKRFFFQKEFRINCIYI